MSRCDGGYCHPPMIVQTYGIRPTNNNNNNDDHVVRRGGGTSSLHLYWNKKKMMMIWIFLLVLENNRPFVRQLLLLPTSTFTIIQLVSALHSSDCGTADMTIDTDRDDREEIRMFGRPIR